VVPQLSPRANRFLSVLLLPEKRARGYISGYIPPGLSTYTEPTAKVRALIEALFEEAAEE
jgi:hypothetical protein